MEAGERTGAPPGRRGGSRLRVSQWFAVASALLATVTVVSIVAGVLAIARLSDARENLVDRIDPASTAAFRLSSALVNQETGVRGFALSGDERFLAPYRSGRSEERAAMRSLRRLVDVSRLQLIADDLRIVASAAREWRTEYAEPTIRRVRAQQAGGIPAREVMRGRQLFQDLRAALRRQQVDLRTERAAGRRRVDSASTFLYSAFGAIAILVAAALITTTIMLRQTVTLPIGALARRVRRVAQGDFDRRLRSRGPRDIGALAADIDSMRLRILSELAASRAAHARLDEQARELERSNAELEQFAYVASHDLQEPLRKVASFCQLLEQRYAGQLDERADQYIEFAVDGAKRMQQLINDLLVFSRVGRTREPVGPVDLEQAMRRAVANLGVAVEESGAHIEAGPLPTVAGEASLLALVFQNLIGNAIKFRSEAVPAVRIEAERRDGEWLISCSDNGIGIDPEYADRVFAIFQRLHGKDEYAGTGIGLAMCRKIVEYHGGSIWVDTETDSGTTVRFTLPAHEEDR